VTRPAAQQAIDDFLSVLLLSDAPEAERYQRAFLDHLAGLSAEDVPEVAKGPWLAIHRDHLGVEPGDRAAIETAAAAMLNWTDSQIDDFGAAVGQFIAVAAPPASMAGRTP
jgi:hypothetical protein